MGKSITGDVVHAATAGGYGDSFHSDDLAKAMAHSFMQDSVLPSIVSGHPIEAWHRFHAAPVSALLDVGGLFFGGANLAEKAAVGASKSGMLQEATVNNAMSRLGYTQIPKELSIHADGNVLANLSPEKLAKLAATSSAPSDAFSLYRGGPIFTKASDISGTQMWKRKTYRTITEGDVVKKWSGMVNKTPNGYFDKASGSPVETTLLGLRPNRTMEKLSADILMAKNPLAARIGDYVARVRTTHIPSDWMFVGNDAKITRALNRRRWKYVSAPKAAAIELFQSAWKDYTKGAKQSDLPLYDRAATLDARGHRNVADYVAAENRFANGENIKYFENEAARAQDYLVGHERQLQAIKDSLPEHLKDGYHIQYSSDMVYPGIYPHPRSVGLKSKRFDEAVKAEAKNNEDFAAALSSMDKLNRMSLDLHWKYRSAVDNMNLAKKELASYRAALAGKGSHGRVDRLKEIQSNADAIDSIMASSGHAQWSDFARELSKQTGDLAQVNYDTLLPTSDLLKNNHRAGLWTYGDPVSSGKDPYFFPMKNEASVQNLNARSVSGENVLTPFELSQRVGDATKLFLSGKDRWDPRVLIEDHLVHLDMMKRNSWLEEIKSLTTRADGNELKRMLSDGLVSLEGSTMSHVKGERGGRLTPFVAFGADSPSLEAGRYTQHYLESISDHVRAMNTADSYAIADAIDHVVLHAPHAEGLNFVNTMTNTPIEDLQNLLRNASPETLAQVKVSIMPRHVATRLSREVMDSNAFMKKWFDKPTSMWKHIILHGRPKWITNNVLGSMFTLALSAGPMAVVDALMKDSKLAATLSGVDRAATSKGIVTSGLSEVGATSGSSHLLSEFYNPTGTGNKVKRAYDTYVSKVSDWNAKIADNPWRIQRALDYLRKEYVAPLTEQMVQAGVKDIPDEATIVRELLNKNDIREHVAEITLRDMIDFGGLSRLERETIGRLLPFWSWMKGMTKVGTSAVYEHPGAMAAQSVVGNFGIESNQERLGGVPSYVLSSLYAPEFMQHKGRGPVVIPVGSANPMTTVSDTVAMLSSLWPFGGSVSSRATGGENVLAGGNPFLKSAIEGVTGKDIYFGSNLPQAGPGTTFLRRSLNVPLLGLLPVQKVPFIGTPGLLAPTAQQGMFTAQSPLSRLATYVTGSYPSRELRVGQALSRGREERKLENG